VEKSAYPANGVLSQGDMNSMMRELPD